MGALPRSGGVEAGIDGACSREASQGFFGNRAIASSSPLDERRPSREVEVIRDQHGLSDAHALPDAARGVRQHDRLHSGRDGRPHRMHDASQIVALVRIGAAIFSG